MNYCSIDGDTKTHLLNLIDWLYKEVISSGGDGDALWYSKYYDVKDILILVKEYNESLKFKWQISFDEAQQLISLYDNQESILITNNKDIYDSRPSWQQCVVVN